MTKKFGIAIASYLAVIAAITWMLPAGASWFWFLLLGVVATVMFAVWAVNAIMEHDDELHSR